MFLNLSSGKGMAFSLYERQYLGIHGLLPPAFMTAEQQAYRTMSKLREQPNDLARYIQLDSLQDRNEKIGMAFSLYERQYLGIHGLLPPAFMTAEQQAYRTMSKLREQPNDLARYIQLDSLQDRNEKLFYRVLCDNIKELMPIVYTPTVGLACQKFGFIYRNPKGLYITINDNSISKIYQILSNWPLTHVQAIVVTDGERILGLGDLGAYGIGIPVGKLALYVALAGLYPEWCLPVLIDVGTDNQAIVVTDGERILGLGDLGAYGIGIPVGKLALYVALAGLYPEWCLPVLIDVGTDNQALLNDPFYTGLRRKRVRGPEYDTLIDNFMKAATKRFGRDTLIQFEDFGNQNAYRLLDRYKNEYCMFNDDIQGTLIVVLYYFLNHVLKIFPIRTAAGCSRQHYLATTRITKKPLSHKKLVFLGAGGAATGVAEMCVRQMVDEGLTEQEACANILHDRHRRSPDEKSIYDFIRPTSSLCESKFFLLLEGFITFDFTDFFQDLPDTKSLLEVVKTVRPAALI
ncbi:malic enzyme domain protein, partial [Ostertagia ostertagi]